MQVSDMMCTDVVEVSGSATVSEAAEKMRRFDIGALPVLDEQKIVGMLTDRDIAVRAVAAGLDPKKTIVRDIMSPEVFFCSEQDDVLDAARIMEENQVRRLVVLDENNFAAGILSLGDLAIKSSNEHLAYEVLERVCEPLHS